MISLPVKLPIAIPTPDLPDDTLPSLAEVWHWSSRVSHAALLAGIAIGVALLLHALAFAALRRVARSSQATSADQVAVNSFNHSTRWACAAMAFALAADSNRLLTLVWTAVAGFLVPALVGWVVLSGVRTLAGILEQRTQAYEDEIDARSHRTRIALLSRSASFVIVLITVGTIMLGIPGVRHVGATLMASAGLIGLAFGAAAQPALKSLIAGLQVAVTQPIRLGDFVVVDSESGRVEDIHLSYVVVRTADERRVIVPTTKFLDSTFQNWTRVGGIAGMVILPIRPGQPIAPIRAAYEAILKQRPEWDQRTGTLLVSEARVGSVELKLVMSAADPTQLANLRQGMREAMLEWLRTEMPDALCMET